MPQQPVTSRSATISVLTTEELTRVEDHVLGDDDDLPASWKLSV